jgi:hypothetical protein
LPAPVDGGGGPGAVYLELATAQDEPLTSTGVPLEPPTALAGALSSLAAASVLEWDSLLGSGDPDYVSAFAGWLAALERTGLALNIFATDRPLYLPDLADFAAGHGAGEVERVIHTILRTFPYPYEYSPIRSWNGFWSRSHVGTVPLPRLKRWDTRLRRLVEMHTMALVDRGFWSRPIYPIDLAPAALVILLRRSARYADFPWNRSIVEIAFAELRQSLTWEALPDAAEAALAEFRETCLSQSLPTPSPPPSVPVAALAEEVPVDADTSVTEVSQGSVATEQPTERSKVTTASPAQAHEAESVRMTAH